MPVSEQALTARLIADMNGIAEPLKAINQFAKTVGEYLQQNTTCTYTWAAVDTKGTKDPQTSFIRSAITGPCVLPQPTSWADFAAQMDLMVLSWQILPATGFTLSTAKFVGSLGLSLANMGGADSFNGAMGKISAQICKGIKSMTTTMMSGTHGAYTGATVSVVIT